MLGNGLDDVAQRFADIEERIDRLSGLQSDFDAPLLGNFSDESIDLRRLPSGETSPDGLATHNSGLLRKDWGISPKFVLEDNEYEIGSGRGTSIDFGSSEKAAEMNALPKWTYHEESFNVCKDGGCCYAKNLAQAGIVSSICSIAAWSHVAVGTVALWTFWALFPIFAYKTSTCGVPTELASAPFWIWGSFAVVLLFVLWCEWQAHKHIFPVWMWFLGRYTTCGFKPPIKSYLGLVSFSSVLMHTDMATQGLVLGKLWRSEQCESNLIEPVWDYIIGQSSAPWLPSLKHVALSIWCLMSLQLLLAVAFSVPVCDGGHGQKRDATIETYSIGSLMRQRGPPTKFAVRSNFAYGLVWRTLLGGSNTLPGRSLKALADAGRMNMILLRDRAFMEKTFCLSKEEIMQLKPVSEAATRMLKYTNILADYMVQGTLRSCLVLVFQVSPTLQLQSTLLGVSKMTRIGSPHHTEAWYASLFPKSFRGIDPTVAISIIFSLIAAVYNLGFAIQVTFLNAQMMSKLNTACQECKLDEGVDNWNQKSSKRHRKVLWASVVIVLASLFTAANLIYTILKIYYVFECPLGPWNAMGCVTEYPSWWQEVTQIEGGPPS